MKKLLFFLGMVVSVSTLNAQTINLIPNPDTGGLLRAPIINYKSGFIATYLDLKGKLQLVQYKNGSLNVVNIPDSGSILEYNLISYNNCIFFPYKTSSNDTVLAKFNDTGISFLANPLTYLKYDYYYTKSYIFNGNLFLNYYNNQTRNYQLVKYDGTGYFVYDNPNNYIGITGNFFSYQNTLFFGYGITSLTYLPVTITTTEQLAKLDNDTVKLLSKTHPAGKIYKLINYASKVEYNGLLHLTVNDGKTESTNYLAKFNGDTIVTIPNPGFLSTLSWNSGASNPILYNNNIYVSFDKSSTNSHNILTKYTGFNYYEYANPFNSGDLNMGSREHDGKLINSYKKKSSSHSQMCTFNGFGFNLIANPDSNCSFSNYLTRVKGEMLLAYFYEISSSKYAIKLMLYNGSSYYNIINPDSGRGYFMGPYMINDSNKIFFIYGNAFNKFQLAYIDFNSLPLKLLSFTAKEENNNVLLNWQTANEINVNHINIQRSSNGKDFENIGKVNASCCSYNFTDPLTTIHLPSTIYYRLEIVDKDGSKTYSTIQQITTKPQIPNIVLFPNPTNSVVTIECAEAKQILMIDNLGRITKQFNQPTQTINCKQLAKGVYIIKAIMKNGDIKTEKLVVE